MYWKKVKLKYFYNLDLKLKRESTNRSQFPLNLQRSYFIYIESIIAFNVSLGLIAFDINSSSAK